MSRSCEVGIKTTLRAGRFGRNRGTGKIFVYYPKRLNRSWSAPRLFSGYVWILHVDKARGCDVEPQVPHMLSWHAQTHCEIGWSYGELDEVRDITPCRQVNGYRCFGEVYYLHLQGQGIQEETLRLTETLVSVCTSRLNVTYQKPNLRTKILLL